MRSRRVPSSYCSTWALCGHGSGSSATVMFTERLRSCEELGRLVEGHLPTEGDPASELGLPRLRFSCRVGRGLFL